MSGAWLVDSTTSELVGHLYAISESLHWGYFIPITETLEDIKVTLHVDDVKLPQSPGEAAENTKNSYPISREGTDTTNPETAANTDIPPQTSGKDYRFPGESLCK